LAFCDNIPEAVPVCRQTLTGPFKKWRHLHMISNIDKHDQKQTEIMDEVEFEIPYSRIRKLFDYRKEAAIGALEGKMKNGLFLV